MNNFKVGIVGCGLITLHKYIPGLKKAGVDILAICDLNKEKAAETSQKFAIPKFYTDFNKMLNENSFDLVCICTPPSTHAKLGLLALRRNAHLLIEKPMALAVAACDELIDEARKRDKKICVGHSDLFYPPILKAKELMGKGRLGDFRGMRIYLSTPLNYALSKKDHWIHKLPGGILGETGPHAVYLTLAFIKNINEVKVMTKKNLDYEWIDYDDIRMELKGENGVSSVIITHSTNLWDAKVDIFGSDKNLYIDMHEFSIQEHDRKKLDIFSVGKAAFKRNIKSLFKIERYALRYPFKKIDYGHELLIKKFIESILEDRSPPVSPASARETVRVMEMIINHL